jgi:hypothetical protein
MKRKGFLIALALTVSAMAYQMVIAKTGTAGEVVYIRTYTPLNGGDTIQGADGDSTQIVLLNTAAVNPDSIPENIVLEEIMIDPSVFGRGSSYREMELSTLVYIDSAGQTVVAGEPVPLSTPVHMVSNTATQHATLQLSTPK